MNSPEAVLITGGAGFIGSHLAEALVASGRRVTVVDDLSTGRMKNIGPLLEQPGFRFVQGSVADAATMDELASRAGLVIHLAAAVGVKLIVEHPVRTIETNVLGTEVVLRAARAHNCRVLIASTSEVYGKGTSIPFAEEDDVLLGPTVRSRWSYAASKMVDEFLGLAYHREYGLDVICFRLFNTIGPRQTGQYGMVVPRFVRQALRGEPLTVYGDGRQSRCFCDVRDVVRAIAGLAGASEIREGVFNIGNTEEVTILELAGRVLAATAREKASIQFIPYEQAYSEGFEDMRRRVPDIGKIANRIGWRPEIRLDESLRAIVEWEKEQLRG